MPCFELTFSGAQTGSTLRNKDELCFAVKKEDVDMVKSILTETSAFDVNIRDEVIVALCAICSDIVTLLITLQRAYIYCTYINITLSVTI